MEPGDWLFLGFLAIVAATALESYLRRGKKSPLSHPSREPGANPNARAPLGLEAIDTAGFDVAVRKNAGLAHVTGRRRGSHIAAGAVPPAPMPEDETYAARYLDPRGTTEKD